MSARKYTVGLAIAVASAACAPTIAPRPPAAALPAAFEATATPSGPSLANQTWFDVFQDTELQGLLKTALVDNTDLRLAAVRVLEARATLGLARADQQPSIGVSASAGGQKTPTLGPTIGRTAGALELEGTGAWDLDFWGRLAHASAAARAQLIGAEWGRRAVVTALVGNVASSYFRLRALDLELDIAQHTLTSRQASLDLARVREQGGATSLLDVRQAEQLVYGASATIVDLERQISIEEHAIAVLLGQTTLNVPRGRALTDQPHMPEVPSGLPSELLMQRPDVQEADQMVVAASAQLESARAAFFPRITLTGAGGVASTALTALFTGGASLWSVAITAAEPLVDGGRRQSQFALADAQRQEALIGYEATVRGAFRDVEDALVSYRRNREFREQQDLLEQAAQDARRLADVRYQGGATSYLELLDAETRLFDAQLGAAEARLQELDSFVDIYRSLGGGWK